MECCDVYKYKGFFLLVFGAVLILNQLYLNRDAWIVVGLFMIVGGLLCYAKHYSKVEAKPAVKMNKKGKAR